MEPADQSQSTITSTASIASSSPATSLQSLSLAASVDDKGEKFRITLDNPTNTYYSGQTIHGTISLNCKQKKKIRGKHKFTCVRFKWIVCLRDCVTLFLCASFGVLFIYGEWKRSRCFVFSRSGSFVGKFSNDDILHLVDGRRACACTNEQILGTHLMAFARYRLLLSKMPNTVGYSSYADCSCLKNTINSFK